MLYSPNDPDSVLLEEQALRDGLQNEPRLLRLDEKLEIVRLLAAAGMRRVQIGSFVDPRRVPQMADVEELALRVQADWPQLTCSALVLNAKGLDRAVKCHLQHLTLSVSVSEAHSKKNVGCGTKDALRRMADLVQQAVGRGLTVRAGVQCAFGCVYEGRIEQDRVLAAVQELIAAGATEVNLADTAGMADPLQINRLVTLVRDTFPTAFLSLHLHDTRGLGLTNLFAGYQAGVRLFDVVAGGLGGCPAIPGVAGNVATEDAVRLFDYLGVATGINHRALPAVVQRYKSLLGQTSSGRSPIVTA